jgi:hypothetical protein
MPIFSTTFGINNYRDFCGDSYVPIKPLLETSFVTGAATIEKGRIKFVFEIVGF